MEKNISDIDANSRIQITLATEVFRRIESEIENNLKRLKDAVDKEKDETFKKAYECSIIECKTYVETFKHIIPVLNSLAYNDKENFLKNILLIKEHFNIL